MAVINKKTNAKAVAHLVAFVGKDIAIGEGAIHLAFRQYKDGMQSEEVVLTPSIESLIEKNPTLAQELTVVLKKLADELMEPVVNPVEVENATEIN